MILNWLREGFIKDVLYVGKLDTTKNIVLFDNNKLNQFLHHNLPHQ